VRVATEFIRACDRCRGSIENYPSSEVFVSGGRLDMKQLELCGACAREIREQLARWSIDKAVLAP